MTLINVHEHLRSRRELPLLLSSMDGAGIARVVLLGSSAFTITSDYRLGFTAYQDNNRQIIAAAREHPTRIEAWPTIHPLDANKVATLRAYRDQGATGLKLYTGHGFVAPRSTQYTFSSVAMDDPRMDAVYEYCAATNLPICLHVNPGPQAPGFADECVAVLERHPRLRVNAPHWILSSGKLSRLSELLDVFPNLVTTLVSASMTF
jgi:predicted TIM-barrel fold metal-dependent hydrolase